MLRDMIAWQAAGKGEFMQVSGIRYTYDSSKPHGQQVLSIEVDGKPIDDSRLYSIITNNYVGGHLHDFFGIPEKDIELTTIQKIDSELFVEAVQKQKRISSKVEGRITNVAKK
jgi:2',3'-cyclic-nucleotide 2'-phosphodiesterase (5'-nucleotidase family)